MFHLFLKTFIFFIYFIKLFKKRWNTWNRTQLNIYNYNTFYCSISSKKFWNRSGTPGTHNNLVYIFNFEKTIVSELYKTVIRRGVGSNYIISTFFLIPSTKLLHSFHILFLQCTSILFYFIPIIVLYLFNIIYFK